MEYTLLLDSPLEPRKTIQIAKLGDDFEHAKYGQFSITPDDIESWKRNLDSLPGQRALIDEDHAADRVPRRTEASGWITDVRLEGGTPVADIEWTPKGEQAIRDGRYLFISPTFGNFTDEHGQVHENTLIGAALTNRPFLNMPSLCLASDERVSEAIDSDPAARFYTRALDGELGEEAHALLMLDVSQAERDKAHAAGNSLPDKSYPINNREQLHAAAVLAASGHGNVAAAKKLIRRRAKELGVDVTTLPGFASEKKLDSRPPMDTAELIKTLDLDDGADDAKILEAIGELKSAKELEDTEPAKTLEQQASEQGMVLLDSSQVAELNRKATAGEAAAKELHDQRFENAFEAALKHEDGPKVAPAEHDGLKRFYELDSEACIASLEARPSIVPAKPHGQPAIELDLDAEDLEPQQLVNAGVHPGSHQLDRAIRAKLRESGRPDSDYAVLLDEFVTNGRLL